MRHNSIYVHHTRSVFIILVKAHSPLFAFSYGVLEELCRSNRSYVFFGAWLRLCTFLFARTPKNIFSFGGFLMYENIGKKLKSLAKVICVIEIVCFTIIGISLCASEFFMGGILVILAGIPASWIFSLFTYGFGELIVQETLIAQSVKKDSIKELSDNLRAVKFMLNRHFNSSIDSSEK